MDAPDLRDLKGYAAIAQRKNFRRAALDLGVSVSSLSTRMRALEQTPGIGLLHRTTRSVGLTEAGEQLLARLAPALHEVDQAVASLQGSGNVLTGRRRADQRVREYMKAITYLAHHRKRRDSLPGPVPIVPNS
jgi:DNA-binding transcriptional LysR family regulator